MGFFTKSKGQAVPQEEKEQNKGNNPYINARQEWLERYGTYIAQAKSWRMVALFSLIITALSVTGNVIQASQQSIVPYIVEVDKLGRTDVVARADSSVIPTRLIHAAIGRCIQDWRTVTADIELQRKMIERLSYFFAGSAKNVLKEWYAVNNPYDIAKDGKLVHVDLKSLPLSVGGHSYRIEWTESVRSHSGVLLEKQNYEATVTIQLQEPTSEAILIHNPGGVYITALAATKVLHQQQ